MIHRPRILLFDSNNTARQSFEQSLLELGYQPDFAATWVQVNELLNAHQYDYLLIDEWQVHRGYGTPINTLREMGVRIPIVIKSFMPISEFWQKCLEYENVYLMSKPLQVAELKLVLEIIAKNPIEPTFS